MNKNMGQLDRVIRILLAVGFFALYFLEVITGTIGLVLVIFAVVFVLTSLFSFCPLYTALGVNTCKKK
jgi:membrane-bound ClpP family serine protease